MKPIIWFDLDGTLLSVKRRFYQVYRAVCGEVGLSPLLAEDDYWRGRCAGRSTLELLGLAQEERLYTEFVGRRSVYLERSEYLALDSLRPSARSLLERCRGRGFALYLLTGRANVATLARQLRSKGIDQYFQEIHAVSPFGGWQGKAEVLAVRAGKDDLLIGDTPADIIAGKKNGLLTFGLLGGMATGRRIRQADPRRIFPSIAALGAGLDEVW